MKISFIGLKPFAVGRSTMDRYVPVVHWCSFMCTIHIDMTAHTPTLIRRGALRPLECSCHTVVEEHSRAWEGNNHTATHKAPRLD